MSTQLPQIRTDLPLSGLRNASYLGYMDEVSEKITLADPTVLLLGAAWERFEQKRLQLQDVFRQNQRNMLTDDIEQADRRRDAAIVGIRAYAEAFTYYFDSTFRNAADLIVSQIRAYGSSIATQEYLSESMNITSLIDDLRNRPELVSAVAKLPLMDAWISELEVANDAFKSLHGQRSDLEATLPQETVRGLRIEMNELYYALRRRIDAQADVHIDENNAEPWRTLINEINARIEYYRLIARTEEPEEEEDEEEAPAPNA